jgi:hypothetical protein
VSSILEEVTGVKGDNTSLVGLSDIGKHAVDHTNKHSVLVGVTGILNDGDDVGSLFCHI